MDQAAFDKLTIVTEDAERLLLHSLNIKSMVFRDLFVGIDEHRLF